MSKTEHAAVPTSRRLLKVREAAQYLGIGAGKLRRLVHDGKLPYIPSEDRGPWLLDSKDLDGYIERHKRVR